MGGYATSTGTTSTATGYFSRHRVVPENTNTKMMRSPMRVLAILWAGPNTLLGLLLGVVGLATGGRARCHDGTLEFYGGGLGWLLEHMPIGQQILAITFGHVILGKSADALDLTREHELVHVRQYERWGPALIPAYCLASLFVWLRGGRAYWDNPFERQAYGATDDRTPPNTRSQ